MKLAASIKSTKFSPLLQIRHGRHDLLADSGCQLASGLGALAKYGSNSSIAAISSSSELVRM